MSNQLAKLLSSAGHEAKVIEHKVEDLFHHLPADIKKYGKEILTACNALKTALASPEAKTAEALLEAVIPGNTIPEIVSVLNKAIPVAITAITEVEEYASLPLAEQLQHFLSFLNTHTPLMRHAGLQKFMSTVFRAIDPTLTEVGSDTSAQILYSYCKAA